ARPLRRGGLCRRRARRGHEAPGLRARGGRGPAEPGAWRPFARLVHIPREPGPPARAGPRATPRLVDPARAARLHALDPRAGRLRADAAAPSGATPPRGADAPGGAPAGDHGALAAGLGAAG